MSQIEARNLVEIIIMTPEWRHFPDENSGITSADEPGEFYISCSMGDAKFSSNSSLEELRAAYEEYKYMVRPVLMKAS